MQKIFNWITDRPFVWIIPLAFLLFVLPNISHESGYYYVVFSSSSGLGHIVIQFKTAPGSVMEDGEFNFLTARKTLEEQGLKQIIIMNFVPLSKRQVENGF